MLFQLDEFDQRDQYNKALREQSCVVCPYRANKAPEMCINQSPDILVLSERTPNLISYRSTGHPTWHSWMVECSFIGQQNEDARQCCFGRKLAFIKKHKPKLIIVLGFEVWKTLEIEMGHDSPGTMPFERLYPSKIDDHNFWLLPIEPYKVELFLMNNKDLINKAISQPPIVESKDDYFKGIELISRSSEINAAFDELEKNQLNGIDIETSSRHPNKEMRFRPYHPSCKLLSVAIGTKDRTFAFPISHPQNPLSINDQARILRRMIKLLQRVPQVAHNAMFEMEWLGYLLGLDYLYSGTWHDSMVAVGLLGRGSRSLNALIRYRLGFDLKAISSVDVANLEDEPLEKVLSYNALDTKYTHKVFDEYLRKEILESSLKQIYLMQMERIPSTVSMQINGLKPNFDFIESETSKQREELQRLHKHFQSLPEVQQYLLRHNQCNPLSPDDVSGLHHEVLGVSKDVTSFAESVIADFEWESSQTILKIRGINKLIGTYLAPLNPKDSHKDAGKFIWADKLIHVQFNLFGTETGRYSATFPAIQTYPSHGGMKYIRSVVEALLDYFILSVDYGQIEYRIIAALSKDPEMIKAILGGLDIHAAWAKRLIELFPGLFIKENNNEPCRKKDPQWTGPCPCEKCEFKEFRGRAKNELVFPFCFGSSAFNIGQSLGIPEVYRDSLGKEFWDKHAGVKMWHETLKEHLRRFGYIENAFGRRYYEPLEHTQLGNYGIQGTASDLVVHRQSILSRRAILEKNPNLSPITNEHDNLCFYVRKEEFEESAYEVITTMLDTSDYEDWLPVPLLAEAEVGDTWGSLKSFGNFDSSSKKEDIREQIRATKPA